MTTEISYIGDLKTLAKHCKSGQSFVTDAPPDNQGKGEAFSPTDLVAVALGTCILTMMGIKARDYGIDMKGATAQVSKYMSVDQPRRIVRLDVRISMPNQSYTPKEMRLLEAAAHGCPVTKSLHPDLEENITIDWPHLQ